MPNIVYSNNVVLPDVYKGGLVFLTSSEASMELCSFAESLIEETFESKIKEIKTDESTDVNSFINKAKKCKSTFTNDKKTIKLLKNLISDRYSHYVNNGMMFDVPRLRIVPNSNFLSSGISYNYKPHRDTWYGAGQDQVNHWMALASVSENSTFYIAPKYFFHEIPNNSEIFDLDEWDSKYRPLAETNIGVEERPHPLPLVNVEAKEKYNIVIPKGSEVVFSGHHLHGSAPNTTDSVRFSIDYRVCMSREECSCPPNLDNRATGNYRKYMLQVSKI